MPRPSPRLIQALLDTADRIASGAAYKWTHQGNCNCGHLARTLTAIEPAELHRMAIEKPGDWSEKTIDYCPTSGYPIDHVIGAMIDAGLTLDDIRHLEKLSDPNVLRRLPVGRRTLERNRREHVVLYLRVLADALAESLSERAVSDVALADVGLGDVELPDVGLAETRVGRRFDPNALLDPLALTDA